MDETVHVSMKIRISLGSAIQLGLVKSNPIPNFTTLFLMTFKKGKCNANCAFCPQARESTSSLDLLSRISWPDYSLEQVLTRLPEVNGLQRICIQSLNYPESVAHVREIINQVRRVSRLPISVSIHPLCRDEIVQLKAAGASNIGLAFDACTPDVFDRVKGANRNSPYRWKRHMKALSVAQDVFGRGHVTTHLMIGLGESELDAVRFIFKMEEMGVKVGLFAFTAIPGTLMENRTSPKLESYRRVQVVRYLIERGLLERKQIIKLQNGEIALSISATDLRTYLSSGKAFEVSGCPGCNRPYYNERPSGILYNFPYPPSENEIEKAICETGLVS